MLVLPITQTVIDTLQRGTVIRKGVTWALRILAALTVLGGIYLLIELLKMSFQLPTSGTIGGLMAAGLMLVALAITVQILLARAVTVDELGESDFTVIPIISVLSRAAGEIGSTFALTSGIGGCLFFWFSGMSPAGLLPLAEFAPFGGGGNAFLGGVMFFVSMAVLAFFCLVLGYFAAEAWLVMVDMARNIRLLVKHGGADVAAAPAPAARPAPARGPSMAATRPPKCPQCGTPIEPGDQFCGGCGRPF